MQQRHFLALGLECIPMVIFFAASYCVSFLEATAIYVACTLVCGLIIHRLVARLPYLSLIFGVFVIGSGLLTLITANPQILIIADSVYFFFGAAVMAWSLGRPRTTIEHLFGHLVALSRRGWRVFTWLWIVIFIMAGCSNEIVRLTMTPEWWIGFQFYRAFVINIIALLLIPLAKKYQTPPQNEVV